MTTVLTAGTVVAGGTVHRPGWLTVSDDGAVVATGSGAGSAGPPGDGLVDSVDLGADALVVPGFVDVHVHGGGGGSFPSGSETQARQAVAAHLAHGTTTIMASLVSAHPGPLLRQVKSLVPLVRDGTLAGIHLEGPWLSGRRCGAHDPTALRLPDLAEIDRLVEAAEGTLAMVTIAPELPGALPAIDVLRAAGIIVAIGHTEASYEETRRALDAGATAATHLFNAMRPISPRSPGPIPALLEDPDVSLEVILDGVHLHEATYRHILRTAGPHRVVCITDAIAAACMPDGPYRLGELAVTVAGGVATVAGTDTIAGGTATTDLVFGNAVRLGSTDSDQALLDAVRQTSANPARVLGLGPRDLSPGAPADLVVLGPDLDVVQVMRRGRPVPTRPAPAIG